MILTFGKHKGQDLSDIPLGYIKWLEQQEGLNEELRKECQYQINLRDGDVTSLGRVVNQPPEYKTHTVSIFKDGNMKKYSFVGTPEAIDWLEERLKKLARMEMGL